jgi:hypothetical protein
VQKGTLAPHQHHPHHYLKKSKVLGESGGDSGLHSEQRVASVAKFFGIVLLAPTEFFELDAESKMQKLN